MGQRLTGVHTLQQALQAQRACAGLLMAALSPANCFLLLALGHRQRLRSLEAHAQGTALEEFAAAMALDRAGFCALPEQVPQPSAALLLGACNCVPATPRCPKLFGSAWP